MKLFILSVAGLLFIFVVAGVAISGLQEGVIVYGGAGQGKVIFDHKTHASKGMVCADCHTKYFETRKKALFTMEDHTSNTKCFDCHNGKRAFNDCEQCHRKF